MIPVEGEMRPVRTRAYCKGSLDAEDFPLGDVSEMLERPDTVVWVDFCGPSKTQLDELASELGFHDLAVEDASSRTSARTATATPPTCSCRVTRCG